MNEILVDNQNEAEISFGPFQLDMPNARLLREGQPIALTPKALDVLHYLASRPQRLITKSELLSAVWPDVVVSDASVKVIVGEIRKALDDSVKSPQYIQTVHRRGYRFIGDVREEQAAPNAAVVSATPEELQTGPPVPAECILNARQTIVGREKPLWEFCGALAQACQYIRQCMLISGGPGSGKTALIESFCQFQCLTQSKALVLRGHCFEQFGASEPYMPVWEALGELAKEHANPLISDLLSRHTEADSSTSSVQGPQVSPGAGGRLLRELVDAIETLTEQTPIVLVLEDVHWADHLTIDLISALARRRSPARLMLIATYRPADILQNEHPLGAVVQELLTSDLARPVVLEALEEADVAQFLDLRFSPNCFPQTLVRRLHQRTDGHPLFLVELVDDLVEQGVIVEEDGNWRLSSTIDNDANEDHSQTPAWMAVLETQIPQNVRAIIEVHLGRLPQEARQILEGAAVAGVEFSAAAAAAAIGIDVVRAEQACEELVRRQRFLEQRGHAEWPDGTIATYYRFAHELYHSVVYDQIPIARRTRLHQQVGLRLELAFGQRTADEAAELAMHFETARGWPRAAKYFRQAARAAGRQYAYRESGQYLQRALNALDRLEPAERADELDVLKALGVNLQVTRGFAAPEVQAIHARAYALCHAPGSAKADVELTFPVLWGIWLFHKVRSDLHRAREMCDELFAVASEDTSRLLQAHQAMCVTHLCLGYPKVAVEHMEKAARIYDPSVHAGNAQLFGQDPGVATLAFGAVALLLLGREEQAAAASNRAIQLGRQLHQPSSLALALHFAAMLHQLRDDAEAVDRCAQESIDIAVEEGFPFWRAGGSILRGWARVAMANDASTAEAALEQIRSGLEAWLATGSRTYHAYFLGVYAEALQGMDRWSEAIMPIEQGIACAQSLSEGLYKAKLHRLLGRSLQMARPDATAEAQRAFNTAQSIARDQGAALFEEQASAEIALLQPSIRPNQRARLIVT